MSIIEQLSEDMDSAITLVLIILNKRIKHIELNPYIVGVGHTVRTSDITVLQNR